MMGKRKRQDMEAGMMEANGVAQTVMKEQTTSSPRSHTENSHRSTSTVQIIVGTYDKVIHGLSATISEQISNDDITQPHIDFVDTFLLRAHDAAVRCLALSPPKAKRVLLASGSSDQEIQVYQLSTQVDPLARPSTLVPMPPHEANTAQRVENKSLGALGHHQAAINALCFPSRSKLLSAADDSTIAVTRTRDWTVLSTIKAPIPKAHGRPSGDTAPLGGTPAGVNDIAIHPSMKLMVSVGKGEKCMRLWNLVTGKRAGVLNFERGVLHGIGEGKWASGEGRRVRWNSVGEEFVVAFEKGCIVYGIDSRPKYRIRPRRPTKIHQVRYVPMQDTGTDVNDVLAISTEDGRVLFYSTKPSSTDLHQNAGNSEVELLEPFAQFGGASDGLTGRTKDFEILKLPNSTSILFVTCCSDGAIRLWLVEQSEIIQNDKDADDAIDPYTNGAPKAAQDESPLRPVGRLIGLYESKHRITCLAAFLMSEASED